MMFLRRHIVLLFIFLTELTFGQDTIKEVQFSKDGGIYLETFDLKLDAGGETIFYTTDGTEPNSTSTNYSSPIAIDTTTVVRAVFYRDGKKTEVITQSYIYGRQFDMPVVSIVTDPANFFSYDRGIYVKGCCADSIIPYKGANFWKNWYRDVNIEFYEPDGKLGFNQAAIVKIFGGYSVGLPMKSLAVYSNKKKGKKNFKHQIFPQLENKKYRTFLLRSAGGDFNKCHFRDAMLTQLGKDIGQTIQEDRPAVVFINGEYWGIHHLREKINEHFIHDHFNIDRDSVDMMRHRLDLQNGTRKHYVAMKKFMERNDFSKEENIQKLDSLMDIMNYIDYNITEVFVDNRDAGGNIRYWRAQADTGKWRWVLYDLDITFGINDWKGYKRNTLERMTKKNNETWPDPPWSTFIIRKLLENDSLKQHYINRFADVLNTSYSSKSVNRKINHYHDLLQKEMPYHVVKWRSLKIDTWERNINILRDFANYRPSYCRQHLISRFDLGDTVTIQLDDPTSGTIQLNSLKIDSNFTGIYFKNNPIKIQANPDFGYQFSHWLIEDKKDTTAFLKLDLNNQDSSIRIQAFFKKLGMSNLNGAVIINEINTQKDTITGIRDWVELYNNSTNDIQINNWQLTDGKRALALNFNLPAKGHFILTRDSITFKKAYPNQSNISEADLHLGKKDLLFLLDENGKVVDSLQYKLPKNKENLSFSKINPSHQSVEASYELAQPTPGEKNSNFKADKIMSQKSNNTLKYISIILIVLGIALLGGYFILRKSR